MSTDIKKGYTRVTELLKPWQDFSKIPPEILDAKAEIGTNVHESIRYYSLGLPYSNLTEREERYLDSYKRWETEQRPTLLMSEKRLYDDDLMLTGQLDALISFPGNDLGTIIDFKCSLNPFPFHWKIQLGWYILLACKNSINVDTKALILQLKDNGQPAKKYEFTYDKSDLEICWSIYDSYRYFNPNSFGNLKPLHFHEFLQQSPIVCLFEGSKIKNREILMSEDVFKNVNNEAWNQAYSTYISEIMEEHCICQKDAMQIVNQEMNKDSSRFISYYLEFKKIYGEKK